jgi:hypothetical protein
MNKILITLLTAMLFCGISTAQKIGEDDARKIAKNVYRKNNFGKETKLKEVITLGDKNKQDTLLFIVPFEDSGYAIVSADRSAPPVLGHCLKGDYEPESMPPGLLFLIEKYKNGIKSL